VAGNPKTKNKDIAKRVKIILWNEGVDETINDFQAMEIYKAFVKEFGLK